MKFAAWMLLCAALVLEQTAAQEGKNVDRTHLKGSEEEADAGGVKAQQTGSAHTSTGSVRFQEARSGSA